MEFNLQEHPPEKCYKLLSSLVVPRPIAWVSTISTEGITNLAPYSFFNVMGVRPPIVAFAPGNKPDGSPKDTPQNILDTGEFVVNLVDEKISAQMVESAKPHPTNVSEIDVAGLTSIESEAVKAPRIKEAPVSMECKALQTLEIGGNRMVIGEVLRLHVKDGIVDEESFYVTGDYAPIGRMSSPDNYCRTTNGFRLS